MENWSAQTGAEGFGEIRWIFDHDISVMEYTLLIYGVLMLVWLEWYCLSDRDWE